MLGCCVCVLKSNKDGRAQRLIFILEGESKEGNRVDKKTLLVSDYDFLVTNK